MNEPTYEGKEKRYTEKTPKRDLVEEVVNEVMIKRKSK